MPWPRAWRLKRVNASREALIGAAVGTIAGLFTDFVGVLIMPFIGAAIGEYIARNKVTQAVACRARRRGWA